MSVSQSNCQIVDVARCAFASYAQSDRRGNACCTRKHVRASLLFNVFIVCDWNTGPHSRIDHMQSIRKPPASGNPPTTIL